MVRLAKLSGNIPARLRMLSWSELLGFIFFLMTTGLLLRMVTPAHLQPYLRRPLLALYLIPLVAKDIAHFPELVLRLRSALRHRAGARAVLLACLPPALVGMVRLDRELWRGFGSWLCRKPPPPRPAGRSFGFLERGSYSTAVAIALVAIGVEVPLHGALLTVLVHDPAKREIVQIVLGMLCVYSFVWLMGDRWLVRASSHVLADTCLELQVGARARCSVPLAALAHCERINETPASWCARNGVNPSTALPVTPLDRPNVVLQLKPDAAASASHLGCARNNVTCIFLYVDDPAEFVAAIANSRAHRP